MPQTVSSKKALERLVRIASASQLDVLNPSQTTTVREITIRNGGRGLDISIFIGPNRPLQAPFSPSTLTFPYNKGEMFIAYRQMGYETNLSILYMHQCDFLGPFHLQGYRYGLHIGFYRSDWRSAITLLDDQS